VKVQQCRCRQCTYVAVLRVSVSATQLASSTMCQTCHCTVLLSCRPSKDPRFDQTIGGKSFSNEAYSRRYAFLYDEVLPQERAALKQQLKVRALPGVSKVLLTCHSASCRCMCQLLAGQLCLMSRSHQSWGASRAQVVVCLDTALPLSALPSPVQLAVAAALATGIAASAVLTCAADTCSAF
jgi:hypothetical protein